MTDMLTKLWGRMGLGWTTVGVSWITGDALAVDCFSLMHL